MNKKIRLNGIYLLFIVSILLLSLLLNIYQNITYRKYKENFEIQSYEKLEEIRYRNESILNILNNSVSVNSISNDELLLLYKNYNKISDIEVDLWEQFFKYKNNLSIRNNSASNESISDNKNQNYWRISELVYSYLQEDIKENSQGIKLSGKSTTDFVMMKSLANDLNNFYNDFYSKNCSGLEDEKKAAQVIKKDYWIDMIQGIEEINEQYIDYPFVYE